MVHLIWHAHNTVSIRHSGEMSNNDFDMCMNVT
ncbi:hypothetical protein RD1_0587 [Roseobacter denitrificans OCh 114]|uniref:Uncharacterized protein n=1 Tax=Roseobacter denitrificans (strain ATCC 33942 / OCh 114) TaxID=375451 RepID=Q16CK4_ROSDO|nr:hypothetical protein RD1_0587 [Roseobacter denitrificans OCh 114]